MNEVSGGKMKIVKSGISKRGRKEMIVLGLQMTVILSECFFPNTYACARYIFTASIDFSIKGRATFMGKEINATAYIP